MLAIIPSIGRSLLLTELVSTLLADGVEVFVVDNDPTGSNSTASLELIREEDLTNPKFEWLSRYGWGIYRTWNWGLDLGVERGHDCVFVLNDDVVLRPGAAMKMSDLLRSSEFGILSFFDSASRMQSSLRPADSSVEIADTTPSTVSGGEHALAGYAFAVNPSRSARCDERFHWYCGDDDLFRETALSNRIGIAFCAEVQHPVSGSSSHDLNTILPTGWHAADVLLAHEKRAQVISESKPHLFVGVPSFGGKISVELHRWLSMLEVCGVTGQSPFTVQVGMVTGVSPVQYARNVLCRLALETPASRVVLIDDDMLPDSTTMRVIMSDADICVPRMYRFRHNGPHAFTPSENRAPEIAACATYVKDLPDGQQERSDILPRFDAKGAVQVDAVGTGFMMVKRAILEDPRMRCGPDDGDGTPAIFRMVQNATGKITDWEDVDFSLRASRLGYVVAADFGAHCGHRKAINLDAVAELIHSKDLGLDRFKTAREEKLHEC